MSRLKVIVGLFVAAVFGAVWAYSAYDDYNVRDMYAQRVRLIPHDITRMAEQHKRNVDIICEIILKGQQAVKEVNSYLAGQHEELRCAKVRAGLSGEVDPEFAESVLQNKGCR